MKEHRNEYLLHTQATAPYVIHINTNTCSFFAQRVQALQFVKLNKKHIVQVKKQGEQTHLYCD